MMLAIGLGPALMVAGAYAIDHDDAAVTPIAIRLIDGDKRIDTNDNPLQAKTQPPQIGVGNNRLEPVTRVEKRFFSDLQTIATPSKVDKASFQVIGPKTLHYNYDKLARTQDKERIRIAVHNTGTRPLRLGGSVALDVKDQEGQPVRLSFQMVERHEDGSDKEVGTTTVDAGEIKVVAFELRVFPFTPVPGRYEGKVRLAAQESSVTIPINLTVPGADIEIVDAENLSYDFADLTADSAQGFVAITIRNKGKTALSIHATLTVQQHILDREGELVDLTFRRIVPGEKSVRLEAVRTTPERIVPDEKPVHVEADRAATLYFKLQAPARTPVWGTYQAFLVVTANAVSRQEAILRIHVPSADLIAPTTYVAMVVAWVQQWPQRLSQKLFGRQLSLDAVIWVLIALLLLRLYSGFVIYWRRHQLGTVEIESLTDATGKNLQTKGLESLLRDLLENLGLAPPVPQPSASINLDVGTLMTQSGVAAPGVIKALGDLWKFAKNTIRPTLGYKVNTTLRAAGSDIEAIVQIDRVRSRRAEAIESVTADSPEAAIQKVVCRVYFHAMQQKPTPEWARFTKAEHFELYQQGEQLYQRGQQTKDYALAIRTYQQAADRELNNAVIRMALAAALIDAGCYLDGLEVYVHVVIRWPELLEPRYRLAATLSFEDELWHEWQERQNRHPAPHDLTRSLQCYIDEDAALKKLNQNEKCQFKRNFDGSQTEQAFKACCLDLAQHQWTYLQQQLYWDVRALEWLRATCSPFDRRRDMGVYLWTFALMMPWGRERRRYQRAVAVAKHCTELQQLQQPDASLGAILQKVETLISPGKLYMWRYTRWWGMTWQVHYNAACAYALAIARSKQFSQSQPEPQPVDTWAHKGVEQLQYVIRDPGSAKIWDDWLFDESGGDPDLKALRETNPFKIWKRQVRITVNAVSEPDGPTCQAADAIIQGWELLAVGARLRRQLWERRQQVLLRWTHLDVGHVRDIQPWYQYEASLWVLVARLARQNGHATHYQALWDELTRDMDDRASLPALASRADSAATEMYQNNWRLLAGYADALQESWADAEREMRQAVHNPAQRPTASDISNMIDAATRTWRNLEAWAGKLLERTPAGLL